MKTRVGLEPCPAPGDGVNRWTFVSACRLFKRKWSEHSVREYLRQHTNRAGRKADEEIERAIDRAPEWIKRGTARSCRKWPALNRACRQKVLNSGIGVQELRDKSPVKETCAQQALPILFPGDPLIWAAQSVQPERGDTLSIRQWWPYAGLQQFIVPNPMISREVPHNGRSKRCLTNTGSRRFLVSGTRSRHSRRTSRDSVAPEPVRAIRNGSSFRW